MFQTLAYTPPEDLLGLLPVCGQPSGDGSSSKNGSSGQSSGTFKQPSLWPPWAHPGNDIWALGCVVYEAATGTKLFDAPRCKALLAQAHAEARAGMQPVYLGGDSRLTEQQSSRSLWRSTRQHEDPASLEEEEVHLWQVSHVLGPIPSEVRSGTQGYVEGLREEQRHPTPALHHSCVDPCPSSNCPHQKHVNCHNCRSCAGRP